jgi:hypothetical protein
VQYQEETGITKGPTLSLNAIYSLGRYLGVGAIVGVARAETDGVFFPTELTFRDTTITFAVKQPLTTVHLAGTVTGRLPLGAVRPYLTGGLGLYSINLDPQSSEGSNSFTEMLGIGAVGLAFELGQGAGVALELTDYIYTSFDREGINPVEPRYRPTRFPDAVPAVAPFHKTAHNFSASLGFTFTPGAR